jgi:bacillopeptidase F (M6 metalloprotease family)
VSANANNGTWVPLSGNYTIPGNSNQAEGEPIYDGNQEEWVKEKMSLSAFAGDTITLRFQLKSDAYEVRDGFYFDDLNVTVIGAVTGINNKLSTEKVYISGVYPNPADEQLNIEYNLNGNRSATYQLLSITGSTIIAGSITNNQGILHLNTEQLPAGIYYFRLSTIHESMVRKVIVK